MANKEYYCRYIKGPCPGANNALICANTDCEEVKENNERKDNSKSS